MEKTTETYRVLGFPELEDFVYVDKVVEKAAVLVPAFAGAD